MNSGELPFASPHYEVQYRVVHGYKRAFVHVGSGPALLLIHGIGNSLDTWRDVIAALASRYTVIAPDLLGHGRSDKPHADYSVAAYANGMRDLLSILDIERVTVVGHSLGGGVATQFAYQYPDRCERLVLVSTGGVTRSINPMLRLATAPSADQIMGLMNTAMVRHSVRAVLRTMATLDANLAVDRSIILEMLDGLRDRASRRAFVRTLRAAVDLRGQVVTMLDRCYLAEGMPTLIIWGARDAVIPLEHGRIAHAAMPGSQLEVFEGAGHFPHVSHPERFVRLIDDFISCNEPGTYNATQWRALLRSGRSHVLPPPKTAMEASPMVATQISHATT